jgi:type VI secretion system secreted protein VgrG
MLAKDNIHIATDDSIALTSKKQISIASQDRFTASLAKGIRAFTQKNGIKLYAGKDDIELQAQGGKLEAIAKKDVEIISHEGILDIICPKQIRLRCEGSEILLDKNGITLTTAGEFKVRANEHNLEQGRKVGVDLRGLPALEQFNEKFQILSPSGKPMSNVEYKLKSGDKEIFASITDTGHTHEVHTPQEQKLDLELVWMTLEPSSEEDGIDDENVLDEGDD